MRRFSYFRRFLSTKKTPPIVEYTNSILAERSAEKLKLPDELKGSQLKQGANESSGTDAPHKITEQKEGLIFEEILSQVLNLPKKEGPREEGSFWGNRSSSSELILSLFEKQGAGETAQTTPNEVPSSSNTFSATKARQSEYLKQRKEVEACLVDIYAHIDSLKTNSEVTDYYMNEIVPKYYENKDIKKINDVTISYILEKCLKVLSNDFDDQIGAIRLFETTKSGGVRLFGFACSASVFNEIIKIRWYKYRDLMAVVNLASEIAINAISVNMETIELLDSIFREVQDSRYGTSSSPYGLPLWTPHMSHQRNELHRYKMRYQAMWSSNITNKLT